MSSVHRRSISRASPRSGRTPILLLDGEAALTRALDELRALDKATISMLLRQCGVPYLRPREPTFKELAAIVISQQLSTASANAIFARLAERFEPFEPALLAAASDAELRLCGLSASKIATLRAIAAAIADGLDLAALAETSVDEARERLVAIKGIGAWTADSFMLFCLGHADVWPAGDLVLQEAVKLALVLDARPTAKELVVIAERWRPYRAVAARLLWAFHRRMKEEERQKTETGLTAETKQGLPRRPARK